jgi:hypothetical protein
MTERVFDRYLSSKKRIKTFVSDSRKKLHTTAHCIVVFLEKGIYFNIPAFA